LTRDIAQAFNAMFGEEFFPLPEPQILGKATRVMSLRDGNAKMSKSDPSEYSRITMRDDADTIMTKIKKAKTDPEPLPSEEDGLKDRPEAKNLVSIYAALAESSTEEVLREFGGQGFGVFKPALADVAISKLAPITDQMNIYMQDPTQIDAILKDGAERAHAIAQPIMADIRRLTGFLGSSLG
jgi:tryptophanyl-tRNA synthetase